MKKINIRVSVPDDILEGIEEAKGLMAMGFPARIARITHTLTKLGYSEASEWIKCNQDLFWVLVDYRHEVE